ncbi:MAG: Thiamine pyrophosphate central domain-containing protein, partial [Synergistales bacterium 54_9]
VKLAESFGLQAYRANSKDSLDAVLLSFFRTKGPALLELSVPPEDKCIPPVPEWAKKAEKLGMECPYWR